MKTLVVYKVLQLSISKINVETLGKFDALAIAWYQRHCVLLPTMVLYICINIKSVDDNQTLNFNNEEEDKVELEDILLHKIPKD